MLVRDGYGRPITASTKTSLGIGKDLSDASLLATVQGPRCTRRPVPHDSSWAGRRSPRRSCAKLASPLRDRCKAMSCTSASTDLASAPAVAIERLQDDDVPELYRLDAPGPSMGRCLSTRSAKHLARTKFRAAAVRSFFLCDSASIEATNSRAERAHPLNCGGHYAILLSRRQIVTRKGADTQLGAGTSVVKHFARQRLCSVDLSKDLDRNDAEARRRNVVPEALVPDPRMLLTDPRGPDGTNLARSCRFHGTGLRFTAVPPTCHSQGKDSVHEATCLRIFVTPSCGATIFRRTSAASRTGADPSSLTKPRLVGPVCTLEELWRLN